MSVMLMMMMMIIPTVPTVRSQIHAASPTPIAKDKDDKLLTFDGRRDDERKDDDKCDDDGDGDDDDADGAYHEI